MLPRSLLIQPLLHHAFFFFGKHRPEAGWVLGAATLQLFVPGSLAVSHTAHLYDACTHEHIKQLNAKLLLREEQPRC